MITGSEGTATLAQQLARLQFSSYNFALTGSRKHGGARHDSDYDFFVQDNSELRSWLLSNDFYELTKSMELWAAYPDDPNIQTVFRWKEDIYQIDIQLVIDFAKKSVIDDVIFRTNATRGLDKTSTRRVWKAMYMLLAPESLGQLSIQVLSS